MISITKAVELVKADYSPDVANILMTRLNNLSANHIDELVFQAILKVQEDKSESLQIRMRNRRKKLPIVQCSICQSGFERRYHTQRTCGEESCRRTHKLRSMHLYDQKRQDKRHKK
jgi:hypothetical protein